LQVLLIRRKDYFIKKKWNDKERVLHILEETNFILSISENLTFEQFNTNETYKRAIERSLEIIGEAANAISDELVLSYPTIHWRRMISFRNFIAHEYFAIDNKMVFGIVKNNIPELKNEIEQLINKEKYN
jgi:uncharacterized protein with HEPN domain